MRAGTERGARRGTGANAGRRRAIAAVIVIALAARLIALAADSGYTPEHDAYDFARHAESIAAGNGYPEAIYSGGGGDTAYRPPGYPYFLAGVFAVSGDSVEAGRIANVLLGALGAVLVYLIAERIWGTRVGLVAGLIAAVFPPLVLLPTELMTESLFVALELGAVLAALVFRDVGAARWVALAGLLAGFAALTRANGLLLIPLVMAGVWLRRPRLSAAALGPPALALLIAVLTVAPWTVRNYVVTGRFIPVTDQLGFSLAGTYNESSRDDPHHAPWRVPIVVEPYSRLFIPGVDEATLNDVLRREATDFAFDHPGYVAEATLWNTLRTFDLAEPGVYAGGESVDARGVGVSRSALEPIGLFVVLAFAIAGVVVLIRRLPLPGDERPARGPLWLWLVPVLLVASAVPIIGLPRYRAPADPFLIMLAAIGAVHLWARLPHRLPAVAPPTGGGR